MSLIRIIFEDISIDWRHTASLWLEEDGEEKDEFVGNHLQTHQAYILLIAIHKKDLHMLKYLWEVRGHDMWCIVHLEVVLNFIILSNWVTGLNFIFESPITQAIVMLLPNIDRCFFIDNIIGDFMLKSNLEPENESGFSKTNFFGKINS